MKKITTTTIDSGRHAIHFIPTNKFKTIHFNLFMSAPLSRDTVTKRALLTKVLREGTKNSPNRTVLEDRLNKLYGAGLGIGYSKRGLNHTIGFQFSMANEKFIPSNEPILQDAIELFKEVVFEPATENNQFIESVVQREKSTLKEFIASIKDDKMSYAQRRLIDHMCANEDFSIHTSGYEEDLPELTSKELYQYYRSASQNDQFDLYILGDFDVEDYKKRFSNFFPAHFEEQSAAEKQVQSTDKDQKRDLQEIIEYDDIQQAKLHIGYRTNCTYQDEDYASLVVFNGLFGGLPSSKLFLNVREKHSLAYYASSQVESHEGLLFVYSGIAPEDYEQTRTIIHEQFIAMQKGLFTDEELQETIDQIISSYLEALDHPRGIIGLLYQQQTGKKERTPEQLIQEISQVTKDDVIRIANRIVEDTVYLLTKDGGDVRAES